MVDSFSTYHPVVNFLYFTLVIVFSMIFMHPVCLTISLGAAFTYSIYLGGKKSFIFNLKYMLPMILVTAVVNPLFNHEGATIIGYLKNGNPLTLESIAYGIAAAMMLLTVICWFSCYNQVMTSDKFVYLFGRVIPALSLILSMVLRFVPNFKAQLKVVLNAQKCVGRDVSNGSILKRVKCASTILSIMITWSLQNAIETADSMKSRGYGLPRRTAFSIYRLDSRDKKALAVMAIAGLYIAIGSAFGGIYFRYYPTMQGAMLTMHTISIFVVYLFLCITPVLIDVMEDRKWKLMQSKT